MPFSYKSNEPKPDKMTKLKLLMLGRREPQYMTAALAGVSPTQMTSWITGRYMPIPAMPAMRLAQTLGVEIDDIQGWVPDEEIGPVIGMFE